MVKTLITLYVVMPCGHIPAVSPCRLSLKGGNTIAKVFLSSQFIYVAFVLDPSNSTYDKINKIMEETKENNILLKKCSDISTVRILHCSSLDFGLQKNFGYVTDRQADEPMYGQKE